MSIRTTIILLTVPLFLALALVNGALLYFQARTEMARALGEQALAAALTTAEFVSSMDRPAEELAKPPRASALEAAARRITGLDGLYLAAPGKLPQALVAPKRPWALQGLESPARARALPIAAERGERPYVVALAPVAGGAFVAARIDAEPMFTRMTEIRDVILAIVLVAGLMATALAWFVARRIVRELDKNHRAIAAISAGGTSTGGAELTIREARELAGAVRLMEASRRATADRSRREMARRDRERSVERAVAAIRSARFAPVGGSLAGANVAARIAGDAPAGTFFALCEAGDRGVLVLGRCTGASPREAFSRAVAARAFLEAEMFATTTPEECLAAARSRHAIGELQSLRWGPDRPLGPEVRLLALTDGETAARAVRYAERNGDAGPVGLLDGIELLLEPVGVFAAVNPASGEHCEGRVDVGLDREDGAEAADVEDFAH